MNIRRPRQGFTLIELLVVLTILGILAALLFPIFLGARHRARMTACASNLHQIGLALQMYEADNAGKLPPQSPGYTGLVQPYDPLKGYGVTPAVYHCPDPNSLSSEVFTDYGMYFSVRLGPPDDPRKPIDFTRGYHHISPGPTTVLADCFHHLDTGLSGGGWSPGTSAGDLLVLHADASVSRVPVGQLIWWVYENGGWKQVTKDTAMPNGTHEYVQFPGESWPPQFDN